MPLVTSQTLGRGSKAAKTDPGCWGCGKKAGIYVGNPVSPTQRLCEECAGADWPDGVKRTKKNADENEA